MLRVNNAFACTLLDVDLKFNPRLKKKSLGSFEKYKKETETLLMRLKLKNKYLQDEMEDQIIKSNNHVKFDTILVILDKILDFQRYLFEKYGLGYKKE